MTLEWSHGKRRASARDAAGAVPPLPASADAAAERDASTGRFLPANRAARRRTLKRVARGLHTLNPAACASWLQPTAKLAQGYAIDLAATLPAHPALLALAGDAADARAIYRGLLTLAAQGDAEALKEARAWLREHRSCLATLAGLAVELKSEAPADPTAAHRALLAGLATPDESTETKP